MNSDTKKTAPVVDLQLEIDEARHAIQTKDQADLRVAQDRLAAAWDIIRATKVKGRDRTGKPFIPLIRLYHSMTIWLLDGKYERPFEILLGARIQIWELEETGFDLRFLSHFIADAAAQFPQERSFQMFRRAYAGVSPDEDGVRFVDDKSKDFQLFRRPDAEMTILAFSGITHKYAGIGWGTFDMAVAARLKANLIVLKDFPARLYLSGLQSFGSYDQTIDRLNTELMAFRDTKIVGTGGSAGVFGALMIGADLGLEHLVLFGGPTSLEIGRDQGDRQIYEHVETDIANGLYDRPDLREKTKNSSLKHIDFFVAGQHAFDMAQMRNISDHCDCVHPRVYTEQRNHVVTDLAIEDGSILEAFRASASS